MSKETFEYFQIYADLKNVPAGVVHKSNLKEGDDPAVMAAEVLRPRGYENIKAVEKSEPMQDFKLGGVDIDFLDNDRSYIDLRMVGSRPTIVIYPDATGPRGKKGRGYAFNDLETLESFVNKVIQVYLITKKRI